jgi:glutathione synthase
MRTVVIVGNVAAQRPTFTTVSLTREALQRGHDVALVSADDLHVSPSGAVLATAHVIDHGLRRADNASLLAGASAAPRTIWDLGTVDLVLLRLLARPRGLDEDDGRYDNFYRGRVEAVLAFAERLCELDGPRVINDPVGLRRAGGKLFMARLPAAVTPTTLVTRDRDRIAGFVRDKPGMSVIKPLMGHGGEDVFQVGHDDPNLNAIVTAVLRQGYAVVQGFVDDARGEGEKRVLLLDGRPITSPDGAITAAYARRPGRTDWRHNLLVGGQATTCDLSDADRAIIEAVGPELRRAGLAFVGLDLLGGKLIEVNAFCPGGIERVRDLTGFDCAPMVVEHLQSAGR